MSTFLSRHKILLPYCLNSNKKYLIPYIYMSGIGGEGNLFDPVQLVYLSKFSSIKFCACATKDSPRPLNSLR